MRRADVARRPYDSTPPPPGHEPSIPMNDATKPSAVRRDILPFAAGEKTLPNGLKVIVVPTGFPNLVSLQIPVQTGSRNEVEPGKSGFAHFFEHMMFRGTTALSAREVPGDHDAGRARARTPTPPTTTRTTTSPSPRRTWRRSSRSRPTASRTSSTPRRRSRPRRGPCSASTTRTAPNPIQQADRGAARARLHGAHLQAHHHGLPQGHRGHAQPVRVLAGRSSTAGTGPSTRRSSWPATSTPEQVLPLVEKYWGGWKRGQLQGRRSPRSRRRTGRSTRTCPGDAPTLPWVTVGLPRPGLLGDREGLRGRSTCCSTSTFGPTSDLYKRLVEEEQKVDQLFPYCPANADPVPGHGRARA